jgi:mersacidin/lichenicidin family type 2 lantibiotic
MNAKRKIDIERALKDEAYRNSLTDEERASLPDSPVGSPELEDAELDGVVGGMTGKRTTQFQTTVYDPLCRASK